jgi:hypothetical protein
MPGEIMLWDNFSVMHRATFIDYSDSPAQARLNYRISLKGLPGYLSSRASRTTSVVPTDDAEKPGRPHMSHDSCEHRSR